MILRINRPAVAATTIAVRSPSSDHGVTIAPESLKSSIFRYEIHSIAGAPAAPSHVRAARGKRRCARSAGGSISRTSRSGIVVVGLVAASGFTMAIFIASLAFPEPAVLATAKLAILVASAMAAVAAPRAAARAQRHVGPSAHGSHGVSFTSRLATRARRAAVGGGAARRTRVAGLQ